MLHISEYQYFKHCYRIHFSPYSYVCCEEFTVVQTFAYFRYFEYKIGEDFFTTELIYGAILTVIAIVSIVLLLKRNGKIDEENDGYPVEQAIEVSEEEINLGISIQKGNTELLEAVNAVLATLTVEDYEAMMAEAIAVQPLSE